MLRNHTLQYRPLAELLQGRALVLKGALLWYFGLTIYLNINGRTKCLPAFNNQTLTNYLILLNYKSHIHFFLCYFFSYFRALKLTNSLAELFKVIHLSVLESFKCYFALASDIIVLLKYERSPKRKFFSRLKQLLLCFAISIVLSHLSLCCNPNCRFGVCWGFLALYLCKKIALKFWNLSF